MKQRLFALLWLAVVLAAGIHVGVTAWRGLPLQSDLLALLPAEERQPMVQQAKDHMAAQVSGRVAILAGHVDPAAAFGAAQTLRDSLMGQGLLADAGDVPSAQALRQLGGLYHPHRAGLLAPADRQALLDGNPQALAERTLASVFGIGGMADARLLAGDPYLLLPAFMTSLPVPASRLTLVDGWPSVTTDGITWVLVSGRLTGRAYGLSDQQAFVDGYAKAAQLAAAQAPGLRLLRLGAVFYAQAGAAQAMAETSFIGVISTIGTVLLLLVVFRSLSPLLLSLLAIASGLLVAVSATLLVFGFLHVTAAIFGASLIGITVDYSLHYFARLFAEGEPRQRLRHVGTGLILGLLTTLIGYGAMALAPLPGLRQVAAFSGFGLIAAFAAVVLWFPLLDRSRCRPLPPLLGRLGRGFGLCGTTRDAGCCCWGWWPWPCWGPPACGLTTTCAGNRRWTRFWPSNRRNYRPWPALPGRGNSIWSVLAIPRRRCARKRPWASGWRSCAGKARWPIGVRPPASFPRSSGRSTTSVWFSSIWTGRPWPTCPPPSVCPWPWPRWGRRCWNWSR